MASATPVGIGIVGTGTIAQSHLASLKGFELARVVGVFDVLADRAEATARQFGIPLVAGSIEELLDAPGLDAVIVCTPPFAHAEPTIQALEAGKHVLCEKPFAVEPGEAERMVRTSERTGRFLACCSARMRCLPQQLQARAMLDAGDLGDVYHVRQSSWRFRGRPGHHIFPQSAWFLDVARAGGGVMSDMAVYMIDSVLWLLGNPRVESVTAAVRQFTEEPAPTPQDVEDHVVIMMQCEGGGSGIVETSWVANMRAADGLYVFGTKAGLRLDPLTRIRPQRIPAAERPQDPAFGEDLYRAVEEQYYPLPEFQSADAYGDVTRPFVESLAAGRQPMTPGRDALEVTRVINAAYQSAKERRSVALA